MNYLQDPIHKSLIHLAREVNVGAFKLRSDNYKSMPHWPTCWSQQLCFDRTHRIDMTVFSAFRDFYFNSRMGNLVNRRSIIMTGTTIDLISEGL